jgi:hypothetical protein
MQVYAEEVRRPSRLFLYYNERAREGTIHSDAGASLRDGLKSLVQQGVCPEYIWPYDVNDFATCPTRACYAAAQHSRAAVYRRVRHTIDDLKNCLAAGFPIACGIAVYTSFEDSGVAQTGTVPLPNLAHESHLGGHAIVLVGFNDETEVFIFRNSWGTQWGDAGYGTLPFAYIEDADLAADFWILCELATATTTSDDESDAAEEAETNGDDGRDSNDSGADDDVNDDVTDADAAINDRDVDGTPAAADDDNATGDTGEPLGAGGGAAESLEADSGGAEGDTAEAEAAVKAAAKTAAEAAECTTDSDDSAKAGDQSTLRPPADAIKTEHPVTEQKSCSLPLDASGAANRPTESNPSTSPHETRSYPSLQKIFGNQVDTDVA